MKIRTLAVMVVLAALVAGCNRQGAAWQEAERADTIAAYQQFLDDYPASEHADEARQHMQALQRAQRWSQARKADTAAAYQDFLADFPSGDEAKQARERLAALQRQQEWQSLSDSNDIQALQAFAARHQGSDVAEQARQRIANLEAAAKQAEEQARREEEQRQAEEATHTRRVQLAAFETIDRAREGENLLKQRLSGVLGDTGLDVEQSGSHYLVRTDPLTEQDAQALCEKLKGRGQDCLVVQR